MRCRPTAGRCAASPRKRAACCWTWPPTRLGVPVGQLAVSDGVVSVAADPSKRVTYGELIGGRRFNVTLTRQQHQRHDRPGASSRPVQDLKIVGQSPQRYDIPAKVDGSLKWAVDVKVPGMVHARNVRPPLAGATLVSIDESSVKAIPGFVRVVSKGNYVAVVCEREEQAIQAARQLKVELAEAGDGAVPRVRGPVRLHALGHADGELRQPTVAGNPDAALAGAAKRRRSRVRGAVPGPHRDRSGARDGRSVERSDDHLLQRHEVVRLA